MTLTKETQEIMNAARAASLAARKEAKALDLVVRVIEKGVIYDIYPNGEKLKVGAIKKLKLSTLKKGTVLKLKDE